MVKKFFKNNIYLKYKDLPLQMRASIYFLFCTFLERGISVITTPIFTRILTIKEYGEYSLFNSWLGILGILVSLNLYSGVYSQGLVKFEKERESFISSVQILSFFIFLFWIILYFLFSTQIINAIKLSNLQILSILVIIWTNSLFSFWSMKERVEFKYKKLLILTLIIIITKPVLGILFIKIFPNKVEGRIISIVLINIIGYSWIFLYKVKSKIKECNIKFMKYMLTFNIPLIPHYLASSLTGNIDKILIVKFIGEKEAGIYSLGYSIALLVSILNTAILQTLEPWLFIKIKEFDYESISKMAINILIIVGTINSIFLLFIPEIINLFAPKGYLEAMWIVPPITLGSFYAFLYTFFSVFEFYYEKAKYISCATIFSAILSVILNLIFINLFGYIVSAYVMLICNLFYTCFHYMGMKIICKQVLKKKKVYNEKLLSVIAASFSILAFTISITYKYNRLRYSLIILLALLLINFNKLIIVRYRELKKILK